jgi:[NiFe] hydrogenase diaphorase moiety large subunit
LVDGQAGTRDLDDWARIAEVMRLASHCGLGQTAGNPLRDALEHFRPTLERRLAVAPHPPAFDLEAALAPARELRAQVARLGSNTATTDQEPPA